MLTLRSNGEDIEMNIGGAPNDFIITNDVNGKLAPKKGHGAMGLNYIIATHSSATYPTPDDGDHTTGIYNVTLIGEIKLFAGTNAPDGWKFCQGQTLLVANYGILFGIIGTIYGGDGVNNFSLPDLRGAVPVQIGSRAGSTSWPDLGERSN